MTPNELRAWRERLGLTQAAAAALVGVQARGWRRWELAERMVPEPVVRLIRLMEWPDGIGPRVRVVLRVLAQGPCDS